MQPRIMRPYPGEFCRNSPGNTAVGSFGCYQSRRSQGGAECAETGPKMGLCRVKIWHEYIGEPTIADAVLERLVHNAHRIELKGESMRKNRSDLTKERPSDK